MLVMGANDIIFYEYIQALNTKGIHLKESILKKASFYLSIQNTNLSKFVKNAILPANFRLKKDEYTDLKDSIHITYFMFATNTYHKLKKDLLEVFNYKNIKTSTKYFNTFIYLPNELTEELKKGKELYYIGKNINNVKELLKEMEEHEFEVEIVNLNAKKPMYYALY